MSADNQTVASATDAATKGTALCGAGLAAVYGVMVLAIGVFGVVNTLTAEAVTVPLVTVAPAIVALAFQMGSRPRRDTEGLIR